MRARFAEQFAGGAPWHPGKRGEHVFQSKAAAAKVYRDGGSLGASFLDQADTYCTLMLPIQPGPGPDGRPKCVGYRLPQVDRYIPVHSGSPVTASGNRTEGMQWEMEAAAMTWEEARATESTVAAVCRKNGVRYGKGDSFPRMRATANVAGAVAGRD